MKETAISDLREARAVLGMKDEFLKTLQREFPDCRIAVRADDTAMIVGSDTDVEQVLDVFGALRYLFRENTYLRPSTSATRQASSKPGGAKNCAASMKIRSAFLPAIASSSPRRWDKTVRRLHPQEPRYLRYRPGRDGKTYLAVALAAFYSQEP